MKHVFKIILILLAVLPLWLTILTFGEEIPKTISTLDAWKEKINYRLLDLTEKKVQVIEIVSPDRELEKYNELLHSAAIFDVDVSQVHPQGISSLELKFYDAKHRLDQLIRVSAKVLLQEFVPVATRALPQGTVLAKEDYQMEWRDAAGFRGATLKETEVVGRIVRTTIPDGEPVYEPYTVAKTLVTRGDRVKIDVVSPGLVLSTFGIAQEAGGKGQTIRVLQIDSRKEVNGTVLDDHSVEVKL